MDSMNDICKNESALALLRSQDLSSRGQGSGLTSPKPGPTEIGGILNDSSTISTETESPHYANSTASFATISTDEFVNLTTSHLADTGFYTADNDTSVTANSFNITFAGQSTLIATSSAGKDVW